MPTLRLGSFSTAPHVSFGSVALAGTSANTRTLRLENPSSKAVSVQLQEQPESGFSIAWSGNISVPANETVEIPITWAPSAVGAARETVYFKVDGKFKISAVLEGTAAKVSTADSHL